MKKKQGCEIEARGISYRIPLPRRAHPLKIWSRDEEDEPQPQPQPNFLEQLKQEASVHDMVLSGRTKGGGVGYRHILKNVSCIAKPWELLAIVGPSGAGKSTLLEILAGKLDPQSLSPPVFVDRKPIDRAAFKKISGYVEQKDTLFPLLTVRETLMFSARLRLRCSAADLHSRVDSLINELGLGGVAEARVGDGRKVRGVSGGERRRVSIGVDVVHDPRVLILDEPTSGLDSTSALQIVDLLKGMAESRGRTVVLSIHQPGYRIVKLFNSVLLLADGAVLHHGTVEKLHRHLTDVGLNLPPQTNIVEFAIESIQILQQQQKHQQQQLTPIQPESLESPAIQPARCTLQQLFQLHKVVSEECIAGGGFDPCCSYANSWLRETAILTQRFLKIVSRTKQLFACRTIVMLVSGLLLGSIFFNLAEDATGARERVGLFAFILTYLLSCTTEALPIFLQEREILMKETSRGSYRVSSYVVANAVVFLPFLLILAVLFAVPLYWLVGLNRSPSAFAYFVLLIWLILYTANSVVVCFSALVPDFIAGNSVISGVMGSFFLFSGYFISKRSMPSYWVFMHYISLFKYPFEGFLVNEFTGRCLEESAGVCLIGGDEVLRREGLVDNGRWMNVVVMVGFILAYRFFSYLILKCRSRCAQKGGLKKALV